MRWQTCTLFITATLSLASAFQPPSIHENTLTDTKRLHRRQDDQVTSSRPAPPQVDGESASEATPSTPTTSAPASAPTMANIQLMTPASPLNAATPQAKCKSDKHLKKLMALIDRASCLLASAHSHKEKKNAYLLMNVLNGLLTMIAKDQALNGGPSGPLSIKLNGSPTMDGQPVPTAAPPPPAGVPASDNSPPPGADGSIADKPDN